MLTWALPDLRRIVAELPERQSLFFRRRCRWRFAQPIVSSKLVSGGRSVSSASTPSISSDLVSQDDKRGALETLLADGAMSRVLVFTRTRRRAETVAKHLQSAGFSADAIHGDKSQNARQHALREFRAGRTRILAATDVAARGIDVPSITHVINYDLPDEPENYVHRIGRTGRAGAGGVAITFYDRHERPVCDSLARRQPGARHSRVSGLAFGRGPNRAPVSARGEVWQSRRSTRRSRGGCRAAVAQLGPHRAAAQLSSQRN
jgi:ATP-dependent RNA helicase RhlE